MLRMYAAWIEAATDTDIQAIKRAMEASPAARPAILTTRTFYVQVMKEATVGEKRKLVQQSMRGFERACEANKGLAPYQVKVLLARQEIERIKELGSWKDRWLRHPIADMREPVKLICWLTDIDAPDPDPSKREDQLNHFASLHLKGSLTSIDRFFMQVRRALTMAERAIASASADRRLWFGKNAYNPQSSPYASRDFSHLLQFLRDRQGQANAGIASRVGSRSRCARGHSLLCSKAAAAAQAARRSLSLQLFWKYHVRNESTTSRPTWL
jgi:hypothetical protein